MMIQNFRVMQTVFIVPTQICARPLQQAYIAHSQALCLDQTEAVRKATCLKSCCCSSAVNRTSLLPSQSCACNKVVYFSFHIMLHCRPDNSDLQNIISAEVKNTALSEFLYLYSQVLFCDICGSIPNYLVTSMTNILLQASSICFLNICISEYLFWAFLPSQISLLTPSLLDIASAPIQIHGVLKFVLLLAHMHAHTVFSQF